MFGTKNTIVINNTVLMYFKPKSFVYLIALITIMMVSCIPQRQTLYLQDKNSKVEFNPVQEITGKYILQTNDYLFINVSTPDPKISEFFNAQQGGAGNQAGGNNLFMYMIDDDMNIDFPYVGKINLKGANIFRAKEIIQEKLKPFVSDANIVVRLGTIYFTALGEVGSPGLIKMNRDQITIFEAIAMSGDLTPYGKRQDIKIVRPQADGTSTILKVDLSDKKIIDSEYYYIYPNDVIFVRPMKAKMWGIGETFSLGVVTSLLALGLTIFTLANYSN